MPTAAPDARVKVLYIGGTGRTGSTLLESIVGQFDGVFNGGELAFLWRYGLAARGRCSCGEPIVDCPTWQKILDAAYGGADQIDAAEMVRLRKRFHSVHLPLLVSPGLGHRMLDRCQPFPDRVEELYRAIHETTGTSVIVDGSKEPHYSYILRSLPSLDLYFLHLVRDPRAIAYSWRKKHTERGIGDGALMERRGCLKMAAYFDVSNSAAELMWKPTAGRYLRLRYEDFVADPVRAVRDIGEFVGERFDLEQLLVNDEVSLMPTHGAWGNPNRFDRGPARIRLDAAWVNGLPAWRRRAATAMTWPLMLRYGYPLSYAGARAELAGRRSHATVGG